MINLSFESGIVDSKVFDITKPTTVRAPKGTTTLEPGSIACLMQRGR